MLPGRERTTLLIFIVMSVLSGGNAVGVRFSNRELDPMWGAAVRFSLAAALALIIALAVGAAMPRGRALAGAVLYGVVGFGGAFAFAYYGLVRVQAGLGQTLLALVPLATLLLAVLQRQERFHGWALLGTLLAVGGIALISGAGVGDSVPALSLLALVGAAFCFGEGAVIVRRFPPVHPLAMNAIGMGAGAAFLLVLALLVGEDLALPRRAATWTAIAYLVVIGSVLVFVLYVMVLRAWSASRVSYTFVLIPIITVLLSAWLDDESVGTELIFGGLLVLAGVYLGALRPARVAHLRAQEG